MLSREAREKVVLIQSQPNRGTNNQLMVLGVYRLGVRVGRSKCKGCGGHAEIGNGGMG